MFYITKYCGIYFIGYNGYQNDLISSKMIGMDYSDYRNYLKNNFNGSDNFYMFEQFNMIFFHTIEDAQKALEWADSAFILNKLIS